MQALELPPDLEDALLSVHWKAATYPDSLPSLPIADLHRMHDPGGAAEWIGIARTDWAITRVSNPTTGEGLPATGGELRPGVKVEFVCRTKASVTARPLFSDDIEILEDMAVGDELPSDISVKCLSLSGVPSEDSCEDKILGGSRFLGKIKDRYTFEYEPLHRLRRNFGAVSELGHTNAAFDVYQLRDDGPIGGYVLGQSGDDVEGLDLYRRCSHLYVAAVVSMNSPSRHSVRSTIMRSASMTSRREVHATRNDKMWRLTWNPPESFVVMPGDLCVVSCADAGIADQLTDLFSGRTAVRMERRVVRDLAALQSSPLLSWMVALVLPNPTSDKVPRKTVWEEDAKTIFKRSFKPVVAGQNRAEYLGQRRQKFMREFRELPDYSSQSKSFLDLALGRSPTSLRSGKPYGAPGKPSRLPQIPSLGKRSSRCERQPRCFLELLQRNIIEELVEDCGLWVEPCYSEDKEKIILLITCSKDMLLREAEHQRYNAELDLQAVDAESLEPCSSDFEPLLYKFIGDIQRQSDLQRPIGPEASAFLEGYQEVVETIETEWADATDEFRARFGRARAFWLAGGMHASTMHHWDALEPAGNFFSWCKRSPQRRAAFMEYMSLRAQWGLRPHSRILMREASHRVRRQRCQRIMKLLRLWSPMVETWNCVLRNHWDRFSGGMKHGRAMAFCGKRPGMDWAAFRTFESQTLKKNGEVGGSIRIPFCSKDCLLLLVSMLHRGLFLEELLHEGTMLDYIALDSSDKEEALGRIWQVPENANFFRKAVWFLRGLLEPPLTDEINHYYSSRIAFYFELTKFLITQLFPLGVLGLVLQVLRAFDRDHVGITASDTVFFVYAVVTPFWVIFVLSLWRRRQAWLVTHWGRSAQSVHTVRPAFWGLHRRSPTAVGEFEITFPTFYHTGILGRFPRQVISYAVLLMLIAVEFACAIPITMIRRGLHSHLFGLALPALIQVFGLIGYEVARRLNEWENYPTSSAFIGNLAFKISCFEFLNRYGILFYIAFVKAFWEGCIITRTKFVSACGFDRGDCQMCKEELEEYVALVLVSSVAVSSTQLLLPLVWNLSFRQVFALLWRGRRQEAAVSGPVDSSTRMAQVVQQMMDRQEFGDTEVDGSFDDYLQVFVLFGYAALFSVAFPAAPLVVAFAMMVELRVDGVKIYNLLRRPFPIPANGLESWMHILNALVVCAVVANAGLAVWTFRLLGGEDDSGRWIRFLVVMVSTTALITITQLAPCFNTDESSLPMQRRTNYIVDNLIDSPGVSGRKSFVPKSPFYFSKGEVASSSCSDSAVSFLDGEGSICNDDVVVRLDTPESLNGVSESLNGASESPPILPKAKSVRFGRSHSRLFSPRSSQPLLEFRLMPCFSAAFRCFYPKPEERSCERSGA